MKKKTVFFGLMAVVVMWVAFSRAYHWAFQRGFIQGTRDAAVTLQRRSATNPLLEPAGSGKDTDAKAISTPGAVTLDNQPVTLSVTRAKPIYKVTPGAVNSIPVTASP